MTTHRTHDIVDEGIYFDTRHLTFKSLEERGPLPGEANSVYRRMPVLLVLPLALILSLAYVIFLPLVGFLMLARVLAEKLYGVAARGAHSGVRVLSPAWLPARAYLARGRQRRRREEAKDEWAEEVAEEIAEEAADEEQAAR